MSYFTHGLFLGTHEYFTSPIFYIEPELLPIEVLHCGNEYRISQIFFAAVTDDLHTRGDLTRISSEDVPA